MGTAGALVLAAALVQPEPSMAVKRDAKWVERHLRPDAPAPLLRFAPAVANTIAPARPKVLERRSQRAMRFPFQLGLGNRPSLAGAAGVLVPALGFVGWLIAGGGRSRHLALAAAAVVAWNGLFHAFWGDDYFLYSQHWHAALVVMTAGVLAIEARRSTARTIAFAAFVALVAASNFARFGWMLDTLEARAQVPPPRAAAPPR
jgi:hypothetical protein